MSSDVRAHEVDEMDTTPKSSSQVSPPEQLNINDDVASTSQNVDSNTAANIVIVPHVGKRISTDEEAHSIYIAYALSRGFRVRKESVSKSWKTNSINNRRFTCSRHGISNQRNTIKCGCPAKLVIKKKDDHWVVSQFIDTHNHSMSTSEQVKKHFSIREFGRSKVARGLQTNEELVASNASIAHGSQDSEPASVFLCEQCLRSNKQNIMGDPNVTKSAIETSTLKLLERALKDKIYYERWEKILQTEVAYIEELEKRVVDTSTSSTSVFPSSSTLQNVAPSSSIVLGLSKQDPAHVRTKLSGIEKTETSKAKGEQTNCSCKALGYSKNAKGEKEMCSHCKVMGYYRTGCHILKNLVTNAKGSGSGQKRKRSTAGSQWESN